MALANFAAGCFWHVEESFRHIKGVESTTVGFEGGTMDEPTYRDVCTGKTGHAETVQIEYDPSVVTYDQLLDAFWELHDPTTVDQQGPDVGTQYRSVIFYHSPEQMAAAIASKDKQEASGQYGGHIVTEIVPATRFYPAEEYHQKYMEKHGRCSCEV
jgi:peptide-methionine (S)-S-oxide reductase